MTSTAITDRPSTPESVVAILTELARATAGVHLLDVVWPEPYQPLHSEPSLREAYAHLRAIP